MTEPTTGWTVKLERAEPQGINPQILLLKLVEQVPTGLAGDVVTTHHVSSHRRNAALPLGCGRSSEGAVRSLCSGHFSRRMRCSQRLYRARGAAWLVTGPVAQCSCPATAPAAGTGGAGVSGSHRGSPKSDDNDNYKLAFRAPLGQKRLATTCLELLNAPHPAAHRSPAQSGFSLLEVDLDR